MQGVPVGVRVDGDAVQTGVAAGPDDADGDLAAVGDENLAHLGAPPGVVAWGVYRPARSTLTIAQCGMPHCGARRSSQTWLLRLCGVCDSVDDPGAGPVDAARARLRRAPRAAELERRQVGERCSPARSITRCASSPRRGCCGGRHRAGRRPPGAHHVRGDAEGGATSSRPCCAALVGAARAPVDPFAAAFSFLPALPREEAAAALRNRANLLRAGVESMRASLDVGLDAQEQAGARGLDVRAVVWPGPRRRWPGASGSPSGSSRECRTCLLRWPGRRAGRAGPTAGPPGGDEE